MTRTMKRTNSYVDSFPIDKILEDGKNLIAKLEAAEDYQNALANAFFHGGLMKKVGEWLENARNTAGTNKVKVKLGKLDFEDAEMQLDKMEKQSEEINTALVRIYPLPGTTNEYKIPPNPTD